MTIEVGGNSSLVSKDRPSSRTKRINKQERVYAEDTHIVVWIHVHVVHVELLKVRLNTYTESNKYALP